jgi:hypothetical protein
MPTPVTVIRNGEVRAAGHRDGAAIAYDWGFTWHGEPKEQRSFVLLDLGFQINQPVIFPPERQGWWYCDLVKVVDEGHTVHVDDHWIDIIVGPPGQPYRVLDLHEYGDALASGVIDVTTAADGLRRTQAFLDTHLSRQHDIRIDAWPDFPPRAIASLADLPFSPKGEPLNRRDISIAPSQFRSRHDGLQ